MAEKIITDEIAEMLRKGYRRAQEFPAGFDMGDWAYSSDTAPCGTVCCYAGELLIANEVATPASLLEIQHIALTAQELIGGGVCINNLFYPTEWPNDLFERFIRASSSRERADLLAETVERFIEADGDTSGWGGEDDDDYDYEPF